MENQRAIAVLRELLRHEQCNVAVRLLESIVFISSLSTQLQRAVRDIADASVNHCESLTLLIRKLGGEPGPRGASLQSADLHFMELSIALPRFVSFHEDLVGYYNTAANQLGDAPEAASLVSRIADEHQQELTIVRELQRNGQSQAV